MPEHIPLLRVFLSSPGDVNDERKAVLEVLERLPNRPAYRERVQFRVIAWDKPGADTPLLATMSPQEAIDAGLPRPSECDIVIAIFWKRMGTPFRYNGKDYYSGTHYELLDALNSARPQTLIYHRSDTPDLDPDDDEAHLQYRTLKKFLRSSLFYDEDGRILRGINSYGSPAEFREKFEGHLEEVVERILRRIGSNPAPAPASEPVAPEGVGTVIDIRSRLWEGSPFPGLRPFTKADAPIFFGRERETDALVKRVAESRFVTVVGASGSGKSSLVRAGLLPRLEANAISSETTGSKDWRVVQFTPGQSDHPFAALFDAIVKTFETLRPSPFDMRRVKNQFVQDAAADPLTVCDTLSAALEAEKAPPWAEVLLFIDQFEELFTLAKADSITLFARMLKALALTPNPSPQRSAGRGENSRTRVVVTIRHDFVHRAIEVPELAELLNLGSLHLAAPTPGALAQMIKRPAELAALEFEDGLPEQILSDMGSQAGALALMAYTLDELYKIAETRHDRRLTFVDYEALGGVQGAIGKRAEQIFQELPLDDKEALLGRVFRELVTVDERGTATRQRCPIGRFGEAELALVRAFTDARLLVTDENTVEVAHEALFRSWERLKNWIAEAQEDLILLRQVRATAHDWQAKGRPDFLRWPAERLALVYAMQERLHPELNEVERDFIEPEQKRLLRELETLPRDDSSHERRRDIGDRLAVIGDTRPGVGVKDGLPDIAWLPVSGSDGAYKFKFGEFEVKPFYIARYLITYEQFQVFAESDYDNPRWWDAFPEEYRPQKLISQRTKIANAPRDTISWYQSVAFARWLDMQLRDQGLLPDPNLQVRLPTEWEWQWAAMAGTEARAYPWGDWQEGFANTSEAGLNRTTAVGMYPHGAAACGALDMAGNLLEWCANNHGSPEIIDVTNTNSKVLRGGSFYNDLSRAAASFRDLLDPNHRYFSSGLRLAVAAPISAL